MTVDQGQVATHSVEDIPALCDRASAALVEARTITGVLTIRAQAAALAAYARKLRFAQDAQNACTEIVLLATARIGAELEAARERGERASRGNPTGANQHQGGNVTSGYISTPTLEQLGLSQMEASRARELAGQEDAIRAEVARATAENRAPARENMVRRRPATQAPASPAATQAPASPAAPVPQQAPATSSPRPAATSASSTLTESGSRPPVASPPRPRPAVAVEREQLVADLVDQGRTTAEIAGELGYGERAAAQAVEHVRIFREGREQGMRDALGDPSLLSASALEKLEAAKRRMERELRGTFEHAVQAEVRNRLGSVLPRLRETEQQARTVLQRRRGILPRAAYDLITRCLHPDSRLSASDEVLAAAFRQWQDIRLLVLDESQAPTPGPFMPNTLEELMAQRQRVRDERAAAFRARRNRAQ